MGKRRLTAMTAVLTLLLPLAILAGPVGTAGTSYDDLIPLGVHNFDSPEVLKIDLSRKLQSSPSLRLDGRGAVSGLAFADSPDPHRRGGYLPVILSLLIPGAGEIYMGYYVRGAALVLMEATAWTGYSVYRGKGLDTRAAYEHYADVHWDLNRWLVLHPSGPYATLEDLEKDVTDDTWVDHLRASVSTDFGPMLFISRAQDKQHYYENIGKYLWFISGWDDWDSTIHEPDADHESAYFLLTSDNRDTYFGMRVDSNHQLLTADRFIYLSLAARAFSLIETIILSRNGDAGGLSIGNAHFSVTNQGWHTTRLTMEYNFK